ncbi:MAG: neutral/alkaline non-lysosomal ceramidase N-terminal domain-containing protein [Thermoguttaceae bacterium]
MDRDAFASSESRRRFCILLATSLGVLAPLGRSDVRGEAPAEDSLRVGLARVCITPEKPLWLHGYATKPRFRPSEGKLNDLYAKAMAIEDVRGERAVLITLDLCVLRPAEAKAMFARLTERTGLQRRQFLVNFSHTHSGPMIGESDFSRVPMPAEDQQKTLAYTARLYDQMADVARAALADLKPATLASGTGKCEFVRNRRLYHPDGRYRGMGPNPGKPVDDAVPVLRVSTPDGKPRAIVFGCACHPVTLGPDNLKLSGDYASFAQEEVESSIPGVQAMFVQGCGADANSEPRCGPEQEKNVRLQGKSLAAEVRRVAAGTLEPVRGPLRVKFTEVDLPLKPAPSKGELAKMSGAMAHNGQRMLAALERGETLPSRHRHPLALWQFGEGLIFVGLSGEVVSGYASRIKQTLGGERLWVAGYSNEVDGYLPDATIVKEGGYEARGLVADIGFYAAEAEGVLVKAVRELRDR